MTRPSHSCTLIVVTVLATISFSCTQSDSVIRDGSSLSSYVALDHLCIYAPAHSSEQAVVMALEEVGLNVSDYRNEFPDGVVGRYVLFDNAYLEVLWYDGDPKADADTRRQASWEITGTSPFGVGLRHIVGAPTELPLPTRTQTAEWMEPGTAMQLLGTESDTLAPAMFVVPDNLVHPDSAVLNSNQSNLTPEERAQEIEDRIHPLGVNELAHVRLVFKGQRISEVARMLSQSGVVRIDAGAEHLLEIELDGGAGDSSRDLRPLLPLLIRY